MTSFRQIEANRGNATGPVTEEGERRSRQNAVRHGLTAETVIDALEDAEDYAAFEMAVTADDDAQSAVERELVLSSSPSSVGTIPSPELRAGGPGVQAAGIGVAQSTGLHLGKRACHHMKKGAPMISKTVNPMKGSGGSARKKSTPSGPFHPEKSCPTRRGTKGFVFQYLESAGIETVPAPTTRR